MKSITALALTLLVFLPPFARAEHGGPSVETIAELEADFADRIDELAAEYFFDPGEQPNFDEPRFNRLVGIARILVERARLSLDRGRVCHAAIYLYHSVRFLDAATNFAQAVGMSGSGFSDDLASLTAARLQFFLEDLIVLARESGEVPAPALMLAALLEEAGDDAVAPGEEGNWTAAVGPYARGICLVYRFL